MRARRTARTKLLRARWRNAAQLMSGTDAGRRGAGCSCKTARQATMRRHGLSATPPLSAGWWLISILWKRQDCPAVRIFYGMMTWNIPCVSIIIQDFWSYRLRGSIIAKCRARRRRRTAVTIGESTMASETGFCMWENMGHCWTGWSTGQICSVISCFATGCLAWCGWTGMTGLMNRIWCAGRTGMPGNSTNKSWREHCRWDA